MERISAQELRALKPAQVLAIDRALANLGAFGEVHIIKRQNRVRFMKTTESTDLLKIGGGRGDS
jgi:hypothetical protein